ncbi:MAG: hypothetical protein FIA98_01360, partial [Anaerolineae bacterium]|nr:hypothetical protein [Anaerolineae bacterium]
MENSERNVKIDIPTLVAISIITWVLAVSLHEVVGHALTAVFLGLDVKLATSTGVEILSDQVSYDLWSTSNVRTLLAAGTVINFITGAAALLILHFRKPTSKAKQYLLWLFATFSFVIVIMYLVTTTAIGAGDWIVVVQNLNPRNLYIGIIIGIGILLALPCYALPLKEWMPDMKGNRLTLLKITFIPVIALTITQILSTLRSPYLKELGGQNPMLASTFVCIHLVLWAILVNLIPVPRS